MSQPEHFDSPGTEKISRRHLLKRVIGLGTVSALSACATKAQRSEFKVAGSSELVGRENKRPGTRDWLLENTRIALTTKYRCPWIEGYCSRTSVRAGQSI